MKRKFLGVVILSSLVWIANCEFQNAQQAGQKNQIDRQPAVAGQFYPGEKEQLKLALQRLFSQAVPSKNLANVVAIISPHAGYVYSGEVAASSFNQIDPIKEYENIFVLGPSHYLGFEGASVYSRGNFLTPLGPVQVNTQLAEELVKKYKFFSNRVDAHQQEHSVEVQLPFLQYRLKKDFKIVPIVVGASSAEMCAQIASALRPYLNSKNLFVISTDFSHYPSYGDAVSVDKATGDAVLTNSPMNLLTTIRNNARKNVSNLATSLCGLSCVLTLLYMTQGNSQVTYTPIEYKNSGDVDPSLKQQVVGYYAIAVSLQQSERSRTFHLSEKDQRDLLGVAQATLEQYLRNHTVAEIDVSQFSENLKARAGAFVTLKKDHQLRGCLGRFGSDEPLYRLVQRMTIASATEDERFAPVQADEIGELEIEISVLTPMRRIQSIDEMELGKHGIYLRKGSRSGVFLPQVATETKWSREEFLGHCARDKAGIGWNGWRDAEMYVFEAVVFSDKNFLKP